MNEVCQETCDSQIEKSSRYIEKYDINIVTLDFGYVVRVGCKSFAFETREKMTENLLEYLENPLKKQTDFFDKGTI
jgi:hypothetical protein